jgi:NADH-quinone oxidoreductase subunit M
VTFGLVEDRWRDQPMRDVLATDLLAWVPLTVLAVAIGVWPRLVLGVSDAAVRGLFR